MSESHRELILSKCIPKGVKWGCIQVCITGGLVLVLWMPYSIFASLLLLTIVGPFVLLIAPFFGLITGVVVTVAYWRFYSRVGSETRWLAVTTAVVICSSIFFVWLKASDNIVYNTYWQDLNLTFIWFWLYLLVNTIWLSWRLSKFAEKLLLESTQQVTLTPNFQNASHNAIMQHIKKDYFSYTRYQLDTKLLASGYSPAEIEATWKIFLSSVNLPNPPKPSAQFLLTYVLFNLFVLGSVLVWTFSNVSYR